MLNGSCLCGTVRYEISARVRNLSNCHCTQCQKAHGAAFGTYAQADKRAFRFTSGEDMVSCYRSSKNVTRTFCGLCGSTLQFIDGNTPYLNIAVGTLDDAIDEHVAEEIWCSEKASWLNPAAEIESHQKNR
ncbi:MAG: GFA family protein [Gammaproteobacteria bacterium]